MRLILGLVTLLYVQFAFSSCDMYSSQIHAKIQSIEFVKSNVCSVKVSWTDQFHYNPSYDCPLEIGLVNSHGVLTTCEYRAGDWISGIVYRSGKGPIEKIYLY